MEKRRSTVASYYDAGIPDVTRGKVFPSLMLLMEALYAFSVSSILVYLVFGFGEFMITYNELEVQSMTIESRFYGCCGVLLVGILCDSYAGHYYSVLTFLVINMLFPILHFIVAIYPHSFRNEIKLSIAKAAFPFLGILLCAEPPRIRVISTAVFELSYFRKQRRFFAILVYAWYFGAFNAGLVVFLSGSSRMAYTIILGVDIIFMGLYIGFWILTRGTLLSERSQLAVVERALAYTLCLFTRKLDKVLLKKFFYKRKQGANDFHCVKFSDRSAINSRSILGTLLIILPLSAYFSMLVLLETLYHTQISMLYFETQLFPLITIKDGIYLILFPPLEFLSSKVLDKWFNNSITKQLVLIGIGAFVISFSVMWTSVVQHEIAKDTNFWRHLRSTAHVAITNYFDSPVNIRGKYYNRIISKDLDSWTTLDPMKPLFILRIPEAYLPFHIEFENKNLSLYDEYDLSLPVGAAAWYILFSGGLQQIHPSCHLSNDGQVSLNPNVFEPATVCVMCALAVCNGHINLQGEENKDHIELPLGENMENSKIRLSGRYQVDVKFGELAVSGDPEDVYFEKLASYLIVVFEKRHKLSSKNINQEKEIVTFERRSAFNVMKLSYSRKKSCLWMFPTILLHAIGQVFAQVSMLTCLYMVSPHDVRATVFSLPIFLGLPAHWYLFKEGSISLTKWKALYFFSLGCTNCLFMIIYFFASVYYVHLYLRKRQPARPPRRSLNPVSSDLTLRTNEEESPIGIKES